MSDGDLQKSDPSADSFYTSFFKQHLVQVQAHLSGNDGEPLSPSYASPTVYWTPSEKDAFYHALCVSSRYRPDLIAAYIKTKTIIDVCDFIDALDEAAAHDRRRSLLRSNFESTMQVSDDWIQWEENRATHLVELDEIQGEDHEDEETIGVSPSQVALAGDSRAMPSANQGSLDQGGRLSHSQEEFLKRLDSHHLKVMETILREAEYGLADSDEIQPEGQKCPQSEPSIHPLQPSGSVPAVSVPLNVLSISPTFSSNWDVSPIIQTEEKQDTLSSALSPSSRRRFQKRLYMRRKRAEMRGEEPNSVVAKLRPGRKTKEKSCKPRSKHHRKETKRQEDLDSEATGMRPDEKDDDSDNGREKPHHTKGGITKPYKIRRLFAVKGIDANALTLGDLGLFHLSTLSRLMRLFKLGHDTASSTTASTISASTIRLMTAMVVDFTSEAVHRVIVSREQEKKLKGNIKVWGRIHDEITTENVDQVLEMMGVTRSTKFKYFAELLSDDELDEPGIKPDSDENYPETVIDNDDTHEEDGDNGSQNGDSADDDFSVEDQDMGFPPLLPLHREFNPPFIYLPRDFLPVSVADDDSEECLMPADTDEDELLQELEEEDKLDEQDNITASVYEEDLWSEVHSWVLGPLYPDR